MEQRYIAAIVVIVLVILFISGFFLGSQTIDIAGCNAQWRTTSVTVEKSELCPAQTCSAGPADQQHNAIVSGLLCACDKAKTAGYADTSINSRIEDVVNQYFGYTITAQQLCDQPGAILVRRSYG